MELPEPVIREILSRNARAPGMTTRSGGMDIPTLMGLVAGAAPKKRVVTPGSPAPLGPADIQAPKPRREAPSEIDQLQYTGVPPKAAAVIAANPVTAAVDAVQREAAQNVARARSSAVVPEEIAAMLASRRARYDEELGALDKDRKQSVWDSLIAAGAAMAESRSPRFANALSLGIKAGLDNYRSTDAAIRQRRSQLMEQVENLGLESWRTKEALATRNIGDLTTAGALAGQQAGLVKSVAEGALEAATFKPKVEVAGLAPTATRAEIVNTESRTGLQDAQAGYYRARPTDGGGGGGDGGEAKPESPSVRSANAAQAKSVATAAMEEARKAENDGNYAAVGQNLRAWSIANKAYRERTGMSLPRPSGSDFPGYNAWETARRGKGSAPQAAPSPGKQLPYNPSQWGQPRVKEK